MSIEIFYVSAGAGLGKTHAACAYIKTILTETNALYTAPTKVLLDEAARMLDERGVAYKRIDSDTNRDHVISSIMEELKAAPECGCVLLTTWEAFVSLPSFTRRRNWQIIVDEIPKVDDLRWFYMREDSKAFIAKYIKISNYNDKLGFAYGNKALRSRINRGKNSAGDVFRPFWKKTASPNWHVYADLASYTSLIERGEEYQEDEHNRVSFVAMLKPWFLRGAIMMGAHFEDSMLFDYFKRCKVKFTPFQPIIKRLRQVTPLNREVTISYLLNSTSYSKTMGKRLLQKVDDGGDQQLVDRMDCEALKYFLGRDFLCVQNIDRGNSALTKTSNAVELPVCAQGLNKYDNYDNIYFGGALNREPQFMRMLTEGLGFDSKFIQRATIFETIYQDVMRTSLRRPESTRPVDILLTDRGAAEWLAAQFGVEKITKIGDIAALRPPPLSQVERNQRSTAKKLRKRRKCHNVNYDSSKLLIENCSSKSGNSLNAIEQLPPDSPARYLNPISVVFHGEKEDRWPDQFDLHQFTIHDFMILMREYAKGEIAERDEIGLFNAARFKSVLAPQYKSKANFESSSLLIIDIDGGDVTPEQVEDALWYKAEWGKKLSFLICNSYSRCEADLNRFRVIIFAKEPFLSTDEYETVYDKIVARIRGAVLPNVAKIDPNSRSAVQSYYLPCTNRAHPEAAFFRFHGISKRDIGRYGIVPSAYFKAPPPSNILQFPTNAVSRDTNSELSPELEAMKLQLQAMKEGRHQLFFEFGVELANHFHGDWTLVEYHLFDCAGRDRKMRNKAKGILKTLKATWGKKLNRPGRKARPIPAQKHAPANGLFQAKGVVSSTHRRSLPIHKRGRSCRRGRP